MKTPLAWLNLAHNKTRTVLAVAGVTFAVVLIFMQLGFLGSTEKTATLIYDLLDYDLVIASPNYQHVGKTSRFPRARLYQAAAVPGVRDVGPLYLDFNYWRNPHDGSKRMILVLGAVPGKTVFRDEELREKAPRLSQPESALIDRRSRREFGPADGRAFGDADLGADGELGGRHVRIVGHFVLGTSFAADGAVVVDDEGFCRVCPGWTSDRVSLGLVRLLPGADPQAVVQAMRAALPGDVQVRTRDEAAAAEVRRWVHETPIGVIFQLGVAVALVVGTAIVYQVLSSDVANHMAEYATLKAIGYGNGYLGGVVLQQAVILALLGFVPGVALAEVLYWVTHRAAGLPIGMTWWRMVGVLTLSVAMCAVSGLGAIRKVRSADPADLF